MWKKPWSQPKKCLKICNLPLPKQMNNTANLQIIVAGYSRISQALYDFLKWKSLQVIKIDTKVESLSEQHADLIFVFTADDREDKVNLIKCLKPFLKKGGLMSINIDSIYLGDIQRETQLALLGLNLNYPKQESLFMEIISTKVNSEEQIRFLTEFGVNTLEKDPYVVRNGISARAYMLAAMTREAFYLVENGYASVESVDRACRNDAGYYLPFSGNYLYMDLMGTVAYALVMKDLNPELCNCSELPTWFVNQVQEGKTGMRANGGLYPYQSGDFEKWEEVIAEFSKEINALIQENIQHYDKRLNDE